VERESPEEDWSAAIQVACCKSLRNHHADFLWGECLFGCLLGSITTFLQLLFPKALSQSFLQTTLIICLLTRQMDRCFFISKEDRVVTEGAGTD